MTVVREFRIKEISGEIKKLLTAIEKGKGVRGS